MTQAVLRVNDMSHVLVDEIMELGDQMRALAARYEAQFALAGDLFASAAQAAPDPATAAEDILGLLDAASAAMKTFLPHPPTLACGRGCSACCHLPVAVPPGVAELIARHLRQRRPLAEIEALKVQLQADVEAEAAHTEPLQRRRPCPLLGPDGSCSVYPVRPIACRAFTSSSAQRCHEVIFGDQPGGIDQHPPLYRLHREATAALEQEARRRGLPAAQTGLSRGLLAALEALEAPESGRVSRVQDQAAG